MKGPLNIHQHLLAHDVDHEIVRLRRTAPGARTLAEALGLPPSRCVAVHPFHAVTADGDVLALLLSPADTAVDEAVASGSIAEVMRPRLGMRVPFRPAGASLVSRHTDYLAGHVCPLLLPSDVAVFVTQSLAELATEVVYMASGDAGTALALRTLDLVVLSRATVLPEGGQARRRRPVTIQFDPTRGAAGFGALRVPDRREMARHPSATRAAS
jgi:prolyl-tRNA editing enzyme YbaK/EbsC (Cys-tRNA(Pro) deacylase)